MKKNRKTNVLIVLLLILSLFSQQALMLSAFAQGSNITGVTSSNGTFNINPEKISGDMGFRHYNDFQLQNGDIANLIFALKENGVPISKFVNLVDNRIYINGILNTLNSSGGFHNGHAIFVSPNGMVVGASGVLNVGSLTAIAPSPVSYLKYTGYYLGGAALDAAANALGVDSSTISIPGATDNVNLKFLKESDPGINGNIDIKGKIFARDSVEVIAKNVNVTGDSTTRAGIFAGLPAQHDVKMDTIAQANDLFNALVTNNIQQGSGFDRDANGNIIIKAQSSKEATLAVPYSLEIKGSTYAIDKLFDVVDGKITIKDGSYLDELGLTVSDVRTAWQALLDTAAVVDAADPSLIDTKNAAKVTVNNAVLAGKNVDVNAVSKVVYAAEKGSSIFDRALNTISEATGSPIADTIIDNLVSSNATFNDFEGSRAKASVEIGENSTLYATKNVDLKSLAVAQTSIKLKSFKNPKIDTSDGFYYLGTKTDSSVIVKEAAEVIAGEDVNVLASSKNTLNIKIKNPTSKLDATLGDLGNAPSIQVSFLQAVSKADTKAEVQKGASIKAGNDVNVTASNFTSDQSILESVANVKEATGNSRDSGIAVAVTLKNTEINTSSVIDGNAVADNDVNVDAQNMHVAYTASNTTVDKLNFAEKLANSQLAGKVTSVIAGKISGIQSGLDAVASAGANMPSASVALVVNDSKVNSTAKIGKNADINAGNNVNLDSVIVDMVVNNASAKSELPVSDVNASTTSYIPAAGVSVIVNNQNNNASAVIEDGDATTHAKIVAGNDIKVNATTEQPMNDATFAFGLNLIQTGVDVIDFADKTPETANAIFDFNNPDWDLRVLVESLKSPVDETVYDISNVLFGVNNVGLTTLGLKGFFNNWAESKSVNPNAIGLSASVVVSDIVNNTNARVGDYVDLSGKNAIINAANQVVQFNAAGDISSLWGLAGDTSGAMGMGGTVMVESVDSSAVSEIGDNAKIIVTENVNLNSANNQNFLTAAATGSVATSDMSAAIAGTTIVQDVKGKTISSIGASTIEAGQLDVVAGEAKISKVKSSLDQLKKDPFADLDSDVFEVGLEDGLDVGEIKKFTEIDATVGVDTELGFAEGDLTGTSVIVGSALAQLKDAETIKDSISNLMITGALARQSQTNAAAGATGSSGIAAGASVNVSEFARAVSAVINDNADITLTKSLKVLANSTTQSLNLALAAAFAGGADLKKEPGFIDNAKTKLKNKSDAYLTKAKSVLSKANDVVASGDGDDSVSETGKLDENQNPIISYKGKEYKTNANGQYCDAETGTVLKDKSGNIIKANNSLKADGAKSSSSLSLKNKSASTANVSGALAGSVNVQINKSTVKAEVGAANIIVGKNVDVSATQKTSTLNIGTGLAKASTVGAGAAVNLIQNSNNTTASVNGANIDFKNTENNLNVNATENNDNVQVAVGVGAAANSALNTKPNVALGGSFNVDVLNNSVVAEVKDSTIKNLDNKNAIAVNIDAENHSTSFKGAGGLSLKTGPGVTGVGASVAGNINAINKTTKSVVDDSSIQNATSVKVIANKDKTKATEEIIDVGVAGAVVAGVTTNSYTAEGALSTNVVKNEITAQIINNSTVFAVNDIEVLANSYYKSWAAAGAVGFSTSAQGIGVGIGAILNILNNEIVASIEDSTIQKANDVKLGSYNKDDLNYVAINMGVQSNGSTADVNGIVNVIKNDISANLKNSTISSAVNVDILSDYDASIFGVTGVGAISAGTGNTIAGNILSNTLLSKNVASIQGATVNATGKTSVVATSDESIDVNPVAMAITSAGTAAAAANIGVNVVNNSTKAYIDKYIDNATPSNTVNSTITSNGIVVNAYDNTKSRTRGGTIAVTGGGTAAVAGSIATDTYLKDVSAYVDNTTVDSSGDMSVSASAQNVFGTANATNISMSQLAADASSNSYDVSTAAMFDQWDITFDVGGSSTTGVAGSILAKTVANEIDAYVGSNTIIEKASSLTVSAANTTNIAAVTGNVSAGSTAAVGGNIFTNINTTSVNAGIKNGAEVQQVGKVAVNATSKQDYKALNFVVSAAGTAAVSGAINSSIIVNETNAYIEKGVDITSSGDIEVISNDSFDVQALQMAVGAAGSAAVGAIANINVFNNEVNAIVGKNDDVAVDKKGNISTTGNIKLNASSEENYSANIAMVSGSGAAAVSGVVVSNTMASDVAAGIEEIVVSSGKLISVDAKNSFNEKNKNQTTGLKNLLTSGDDIETSSLETADKLPLVSILNIAGAASAAVSGTVVNSNVITAVDVYVRNAEVSSANGLNLNAISQMTTYDAVMGVSGSVFASVAATVVTNTYSGVTKSEIADSKINGSVSLDAQDKLNLNTIMFAVAGTGMGASVLPVTNLNVVENDVYADIKNTAIDNASAVNVTANNEITVTDGIVAGSGNGIGAAVNVVPITNVFTGKTRASISETSSITGTSVTTNVKAKNKIDSTLAIVGLSGNGIGALVGGYAMTNVFDNDLESYIEKTTISTAATTNVEAESDLDMNSIMGSGSVNGVGASVIVNATTNVIKNNVKSYINDSELSGGNVVVKAIQNANIVSNNSSISANGVGNSTAVNSLVNVFTSNLDAYIDDTEINDVSSITVMTDADEILNNSNLGVSVSGAVADAANSIVNVLENNSHAYIDANNKPINASGTIKVVADDNLSLVNSMGMLTASGVAAGANINVNVINNAVKAEVLNDLVSEIKAGNLVVEALSTMYLDEKFVSASAGLVGIAGNVIINSIGSKVNLPQEIESAKITSTLTKANENYDNKVSTVSYEKDGQTKNLANEYSLTGTSTEKRGTIANLKANVTTTGERGVVVNAKNTVKGAGAGQQVKLTNATGAAGKYAAGASVLVTDMQYNTAANISGGKVAANDSVVNVSANSGINVDIDTIEATVGVVGVAGNVGYVRNNAVTDAIISNTIVDTNTVNINSTSSDNINVNVVSASVVGVLENVSIGIAETQNNVNAKITGDDGVDIDAKNINIIAGNSSTLNSEIEAIQVNAVAFKTVVSRAKSSAITTALIDAAGSIDVVDKLNIIAQSAGVSSTVTMNLGSIALAGVSLNSIGANASSEFKAGIDNSSINVSSNNTNIKSGVSSRNNDNAATVTSEILSEKASVSLAETAVTNLKAEVAAKTTAVSNAGLHKSNNISLISKLKRIANVGASSSALGVIDLGSLNMSASTNGSNNINVSGNHQVANNFDINLVDTSNTQTQMLNAKVNLLSGSLNTAKSTIGATSTIDFGGKVTANDVKINSNVEKSAFNTADSLGVGLAIANKYQFTTSVSGDSKVNVKADMSDNTYANNLSVISKAINKAESILSENYVALAAIARDTSKNELLANNYINVENANINSTGTVKFDTSSDNRATMKKDSSGVGMIVFSGGELQNTINANANITVKDSNVLADTIKMATLSNLGTIDNKDAIYTVKYKGAGVKFDTAKINNKVEQGSKIGITSSTLAANDKMDIDVKTSSTFIQGIETDGQGFVTNITATSNLEVKNNNELNIGEGTTISADDMTISQDSNNKLKSYVDIDISNLGGMVQTGDANLTLNVNNKIANKGSIKGKNLVDINFMKNSINELTQSTDVKVEAAIAVGKASGSLTYNVANALEVAQNADITSAQDIVVNYASGNNFMNSNVHSKKVSRIVFGIPIKSESSSKNISQTVTNSLDLKGEIVAGSNAKRYMLIDKDGNVDMASLVGFLESEYKVIDAVNMDGETITNEAIAAIEKQINELTDMINTLNSDEQVYSNEISRYETLISELQSIYNSINDKSTILESTVETTMKNNIQAGVVLADGETNANKISQDVFDRIYDNYSTGDFETYLSNFVVTAEQKDSNGVVTQPEVKLTSAQITNFVNSVTTEQAKISTIAEADVSLYNGQIIVSDANEFTTIKNDMNSSLNALKQHKERLSAYHAEITTQINSLTSDIAANNAQKSYLEQNPLSDFVVEKAAIEFGNLFVKAAKIDLKGIKNTEITDNGNFKIYSPSLVIDNYSNRDLIFKNIDLGHPAYTGLNINGKNYNSYLNTLRPVNSDTVSTSAIGQLVHYMSVETGADLADINNIVINNYYDALNPALSNAIASDITFSGYVITPKKVEVFNDSGNIDFASYITSVSKNIMATQGDVNYIAPSTTLTLQSGDKILAGKDVNINANNIVMNGNIKAGYGNRNLTITDDMLNNLIVDPTTGEQNMIDLSAGNKSAYLNETNNIKALYKDGKILLFNTKQEGGNVKLTGTVSGNGAILYTNGYADVKIDNQTTKQLVVNVLENNRMDGVVANAGSITNITNQGKNKATTEIKSKGLVDIIGAILNGKNNKVTDEKSVVSINSENGVNINKKEDLLGQTVPTIDAIGDVNITNSNSAVNVDGVINVVDGDLLITNNGTNTTINEAVKNEAGNVTVLNSNGKLHITSNGSITNNNGDTSLTNNGDGGMELSGSVLNEIGNIALTNTGAELLVNTSVTANSGNITTNNSGENGTTLTENACISANGANSKLEMSNTNGGITVANGAQVVNNSQTNTDNLKISNSGTGLLSILGSIFNKKGNIVVDNTNAQSGIAIATTGMIKNEAGNITISNKGAQGFDVDGRIQDVSGNIAIINEASNLVIGEYASTNDNYILAENGDVVITQINGNILNGIVDADTVSVNQNHNLGNVDKAYKTLINSQGNLVFNIQNGNLGADSHAIAGKESGFGINASTRDYTESINVNVAGALKADAVNNGLFNLRAKESNLNIDSIATDGNVMITVADWKQADVSPAPQTESYYQGYSILNSSADSTKPNVTGKNISLISSNDIGSSAKKLTYKQLSDGSLSVLSENNINISGLGDNDTVWQMIAKRGNLDFSLSGDAQIREIAAAKNMKVVSTGENLTIYDLGKISNITPDDDILYAHDGIDLNSSNMASEQIALSVLGDNSTLNIYNAYVKGLDNNKSDVELKADNIIAHAYDAPSSVVSTKENPSGFDPKLDRTYANDITDSAAVKDLKASGFNAVGAGKALKFDIQGVSKSDVVAAGGNGNSRDYNMQNPVMPTKPEFINPNAFKKPVAKAENVSLSLNSGENSSIENRGLLINKLYADNAYVDTKDLNLKALDTYITNYGEFRNGNRGASAGGHIIGDEYRWLNIVDNDYKRNIANIFGVPVTSQIYTALTGSFMLEMGDVIALGTKAPVVLYNPNNVITNPATENSFFRLTYKDNKIQYTTTTPEFDEIDKSTYIPNKRNHIRFSVISDGIVQVANKTINEQSGIVSVLDISKGGLLVMHDGSLKINEKFVIELSYNDISTRVETEVVRLGADNMAGLKFINMDKATANKILYMNMSLRANRDVKVKLSNN